MMLNSKAERILWLYTHLQAGQRYTKRQLSDDLKVDERTIQRDIAALNKYLEEIDGQRGVYVRNNTQDHCYELIGREEECLNSGEILVLAKVLLESRALEKEELDTIIKKLINYSKWQGQQSIEAYILNEQYHYTELQNNSKRIAKLVDLTDAINSRKKVRINYIKQSEELVERIIRPVSVMFSEYYFYLVAYLKHTTKPIMYRIDRVLEYEILEEHFKIEEQDRFEEGEARKRIQFMYSGDLMQVKLKFSGASVEALLDRLPTARIIEQHEGTYILEAEVYGKGIKMWLLSQAQYIEVLEPLAFRDEMKETIQGMLNRYQ